MQARGGNWQATGGGGRIAIWEDHGQSFSFRSDLNENEWTVVYYAA